MKELIQQIKWQFILLQRNNIITISVVVTAIYALLFFVIMALAISLILTIVHKK